LRGKVSTGLCPKPTARPDFGVAGFNQTNPLRGALNPHWVERLAATSEEKMNTYHVFYATNWPEALQGKNTAEANWPQDYKCRR